MMMFYSYVLFSAKIDKLYFGYTQDVDSRLKRHNSGSQSYTATGRPWELRYLFLLFNHKKNP